MINSCGTSLLMTANLSYDIKEYTASFKISSISLFSKVPVVFKSCLCNPYIWFSVYEYRIFKSSMFSMSFYVMKPENSNIFQNFLVFKILIIIRDNLTLK